MQYTRESASSCHTFPLTVRGLWTRYIWILALVTTIIGAFGVRAQDLDGDYLKLLSLIVRADTLNDAGHPESAIPKYRQALTGLEGLQSTNRDYKAKAVAFRVNYVTNKLASLSKPATGGAEAESSETANASGGSKASSGGGSQVKLLEPGAEPRQQLRLHPKVGDAQKIVMNMKMGMGMKIGGMDNPGMKLPGMTFVMDVNVKDVSPEGDITYEMVISDSSLGDEPGALPQVTDAMKASLDSVKGLTVTTKISNRAINKGTEVKTPPDATPQVKQTLDQMKETFSNISSPLPEEAVGVGAKWETAMAIKSQGMTIQQKAIAELASIDGDKANLKSALTQDAANQKIENPAMPGIKVDLNKMAGKGTADVTMDLSKVIPLNAAVQMHSDMDMGMNMGGQKQSMAMKLDIDMHLESK